MRADSIPDAIWPRLSELIAEKTGLHFPPERRSDLQRGLVEAAAELGFANVGSCADWLLSASLSVPELHTLAGHLTIGETYFFRERKTLEALAGRILPELISRRRGHEKRLRLWSAACSTGEEAYSLAILLRDLLPDWQDWRVTILATDINKRSLQKAAAGVYGEWSFRESPPEFKDRYFTRTADRRFALLPEIRKCVSFAQLNLAQDGFPSLAPETNAMDVILCRNVLIYFTPSQARKLVANLHSALLEDAWLAVSPSECSQSLFSGFVAVNFPGAILYQKTDAALVTAPLGTGASSTATSSCAARLDDASAFSAASIPDWPPTDNACAEPETEPSVAREPSDPCAEAEALYRQGRYADAAELLFRSFAGGAQESLPPSPAAFSPQALSLLARALANQGKLADALTWIERWIAHDKVDAGARYLHAMVLQELGEREQARRSLQRAVYLQPDFALAHFALGSCARGDSRRDEANKHFDNALRVLRRRPSQELVPESDGLTAGRLTEMISALSSQGQPAREERKR